jgi:hypothetical protein
MKKSFCILLALFLFYPVSVLSAGEASKYLDDAQKNLSEVTPLLKEFQNSKKQETLADAAKCNNKAYENAKGYSEIQKLEYETLLLKAYGTRGMGSSPRKSDAFATIDSTRDTLFATICTNDNTIAQAFWKDLNQDNEAKERYRTILKKYKIETTNEDLKTCVKNAEFALEDIAAEAQRQQQQAQAQSQQQAKIEMDNMKKENELLKKEIELLKSENANLKTKLQQAKKRK